MKHEDVRVGMKVRPFQKTAIGCEENSIADYMRPWGNGNFLKQNGYLYVVNKEDGVFVLGDVQECEDGDYFNAEDFEPYVEKELDAREAVHHIVNGINEMEYISTRKELKALRAFKDDIDMMYGQGYEISNFHQNGKLEPFDNFYKCAMACYDEIMEDE